jgi:hypothetical protein
VSARRPPTREAARRRAARRRQVRRRRLGALLVLVGVVLAAVLGIGALIGGGSSGSATRSASTQAARATAAAATTPPPDGALGQARVRRACTLLTREEIGREMGRPVGAPTAVWPYCQWLVGDDAFVALTVEPFPSVADLRERSLVARDLAGIGQASFLNLDGAITFGDGTGTYHLQWQKAGEFSPTRQEQLTALAHDVLDRAAETTEGTVPATTTVPTPTPHDGARPTRKRPLRVYFGGDSLAGGPAWAFSERALATRVIRPITEFQVSTGLVRTDFFNWPRHIKGVMAGRRPEVVIVMVGANDRQDIVLRGVHHGPGDAVWTREYRRRVGEVMRTATAGGARLIWVGMPAMRDPGFSEDMSRLDEIYASEARRHRGVAYVDAAAALGGAGGAYSDTATDASGRTVSARAGDGVHLTADGSRLLAAAIMRELARVVRLPRSATAP